MKSISQKTFLYVLTFIVVTVLFHLCYGLDVLVPTNINWLMSARHDWGQHYLGWAFYKNEPWHFPLGTISNFIYPAGCNVGFTDSIPLIAIPLKIVAPLLSDDFQYLGLWMYACYLLTAYYCLKIFELYNIKFIYQLIGLILIVGNPMLVFRGLHPSLCAHWLLLAPIYLYLTPANKDNVKSLNKKQIILLALSALIHPYLAVIVFCFNIILPFKHYFYYKLLTLKQMLLYPFIALLSTGALWFIVGVLTFKGDTRLEVSGGYGLYSFNLNSFYNPSGFSFLLPARPLINDFQYESYMYLGVGLMAIIVLGFIWLIVSRKMSGIIKNKTLIPLYIVTFLLTLFAISQNVTYDDILLFEVPVPKFIIKIGNIFRASARFAWVLYYLLCLFFVIVIVKVNFNKWVKLPVLLVLLAVQLYDIWPIYTFRNLPYGAYHPPLNEEKWNEILPHFDRIITYPPFENNLLTSMDYQDLCFLAVKHDMAISTGYSARVNRVAERVYDDYITTALQNNVTKSNELYITTPEYIEAFNVPISNKTLQLIELDNYYLLYNSNKKIGDFNKSTAATIAIKEKLDQPLKKVTSEIKPVVKITLPKTNPLQKGYIDDNIDAVDYILISGWTILRKENSDGQKIKVFFYNDKDCYAIETDPVVREDVTAAYKDDRVNYNNSGFNTKINKSLLPSGEYTIGIIVTTKNNKTYGLITKNTVTIQ
ncbi:DUF6311 domain-containing protein [Flavobacterium rhizosphaerae]|uniref:DUF6311 domain-containing protein n=1 Tax=Flavobacterium rhizosphaerae TaxID=3163298 RepID=A0ABW8YZ27_9FLAO